MSSENSEIDKKIQCAAELSQKILDALKSTSKEKADKISDELNVIINNNEKDQEERRTKSRIENERRRDEIRRKWKRY